MATCKELAAQYRAQAAKIKPVVDELKREAFIEKRGNVLVHRRWTLAYSMYRDCLDTARHLESYG